MCVEKIGPTASSGVSFKYVNGRFMAPEVLSSTVGPPADVWAAGVMAYQLLCGFLPFDDRCAPCQIPTAMQLPRPICFEDRKLMSSSYYVVVCLR